jgi:hypothetical protein
MTEKTFPYGYTGDPQGMGCMLTWDQMMTKKSVYNLHPEVRRRFRPLIEYAYDCGVHLGVGTGWRVQPNPPPPGFAKPGNSWHESCPVSPQTATALAIDTVCNVSWDWMESNCRAYGFRTFRYVGNEPWHIQPYEIPASRKYATKLPPLENFQLPGSSTPIPTPGDDDDMASVIKGDGSDTYYAWNGVVCNGIPGLEWVQWGVENGLYKNSDPIVYPQGFIDQLVAAQGER